jgi:transcriptional regulator with XRE-family HTH domain
VDWTPLRHERLTYLAQMDTEITFEEVGRRLRKIRSSRGFSLSEVESLSKGRLKAVVLGSYERGARALTVKRALEIAQIYQIPISRLFSDQTPLEIIHPGRTIVDLRAINRRALDETHQYHDRYILLARIAQRIVRARQDWNGEVLSLRESDIETIALVVDLQISETLAWLDSERVLLKKVQN